MELTTRDAGPRVLMVVRLFHPWIGGTERQAHKLARALIRRGTDVQIVTGRWFRGTARSEVLDGVPVFRNQTLWECFGIKGLRKFGGYLYIASLLLHLWRRRATYDVIHVHGLNYHTFAAVVAGRRLGKPVVTKLANSGPASDVRKMRQSRQLALTRFLLPVALRCDRFVALNPAVVTELLDAGVPRDRIVEIPNGVEIPDDEPAAGAAAPGGALRLLYLGRLHPQKGLDTLLHAVAAVNRDVTPPVRLRLVGDGPARAELLALTRRLGISAHVDFAGPRDDVRAELRDADAFVLPSRAEGLSNALLEAMAAGMPVVVSDVPGNRDVVTHDRTGLVAAVDDADAFAVAIARLAADPGLRGRLAVRARQAVAHTYDMRTIAERYAALYRSLTERAGDPVGVGRRTT